ncbi:MAG: tRNA (adenosine(37)-N6)-dimethylallyltransferase MiaA [Clostridia bacterium]|nr:tRNA (adenosine(37)-N6)-dimethylallyltransferase MiaA [Clostridia bacterium]
MSGKPKIIAVVGPTASGKTALSIALAKQLCGEIVSCDSMQIYRGMDIGTAKPDAAERDGVPHHLIDIVAPDADFDASDYVSAATAAVDDILSRGKLPIFCGGTGLYLDSFLRGGFCETADSPELRAELTRRAEKIGNEAMHAELADVDPESAAAIHPNNVRRVIRALEVYHATGITKSELDRRSREAEPRYDAKIIGIRFSDREQLYRRIDMRVDIMLEMGLLDEVRRLYDAGVFERSRTAAQAIGYKELLGVIKGETALDIAVDDLKRATRRYAKRQLTWFGAHKDIIWLDRDDSTTADELIQTALSAVGA